MSKPTNVLVLGATGKGGRSIVDGLIEYGGYKIFAGIRPASMNGSVAVGLQAKGVQLRTLDLDDLSDSSLTSALDGIQVVVSAVTSMNLKGQIPVIEAAKKAGVERFIPSDFGTAFQKGTMDILDQKLDAGSRGRRELYEQKLAIRDHIVQIGLDHTFVDVGWWTQNLLPPLKPSQNLFGVPPQLTAVMKSSFGDGKTKCAITDMEDIGHYVARVISDPRTINKYVFCWSQEVTTTEYIAAVREASGIEVEFVHVSDDDVRKNIETGKAENNFLAIIWEYMQSLWIIGENVVSNAVKPEYGSALDARRLYTDFKPRTLRETAQEFYSK